MLIDTCLQPSTRESETLISMHKDTETLNYPYIKNTY